MARGGAGHSTLYRLFAGQEDDNILIKKDDDHVANSQSIPAPAIASWSPAPRPGVRWRSKRRVVTVVAILLALWMFFRSLPDDIWEPNEIGRARIERFHGGGKSGNVGKGGAGTQTSGSSKGKPVTASKSGHSGSSEDSNPPPRPKGVSKTDPHYYNGEITFPNLLRSLRAVHRTFGFRRVNQNILFAASNLKSLGTLLPLACEMLKWENNFVHVVLFGRSDLSWDEIHTINGISTKECPAFWHDARPNWAIYSSDFRIEGSVASALEHIEELMHPQAVIMDDSILDDRFFTRQLRIKAKKFELPIVELPAEAGERLHWLARLDAQSIRTFHDIRTDILVQAPAGEVGSLVRLLKSLADADYHGLIPPKLTIELPAQVDPALSWFLADYKWPPPLSPLQPGLSSLLTLRHRIPGQILSSDEASVRFLESFYPAKAETSNVLILNPNVELSPTYYHSLVYHVLQHRHSLLGSGFSQNMVGLSLDLPTTYLNGSAKFEAPIPEMSKLGSAWPNEAGSEWPGDTDPRHPDTRPPFLWQAPNANAALYFGDKWAELHDFLRNRIVKKRHADGKTESKKIVAEHLPAWTEYLLELMRARGLSMLYPASSQRMKNMAVVHTELYQPPEEFQAQYKKAKDEQAKYETEKQEARKLKGTIAAPENEDSTNDSPLRALPAHWELPKQNERPLALTSQPLHAVLPFLGEEPAIQTLPQLLYDGTQILQGDVYSEAVKYADEFRSTVGGCPPHKGRRKIEPGTTHDLFCWGEEDESGWEDVPNLEMTGG